MPAGQTLFLTTPELVLASLQLEALARAAEADLAKNKAEGADLPSIKAFEDFQKKMRRRGDSDVKRAEKLARRRDRWATLMLTLLTQPQSFPL